MVLLSILKEKRKIILENICMIRIHIFFAGYEYERQKY